MNPEDQPKVKAIVRKIQHITLNCSSVKFMPYIEIKTRKLIDSTLAKQIINKGTVSAVLTTGKITGPAKAAFDEAAIAWAENIAENQFLEYEAQEVE